MKKWLVGLLLMMSGVAFAGSPAVYEKSVKQDFETTYKNVYNALEAKNFFVVFEPDIGSRMARFAERWGDDYNKNGLEAIRSMVFCNLWYANQVSNADPALLALCPLHLTMTLKDGTTTVYFTRPSAVAKDSAAEEVARKLEGEIIEAIETGLAGGAAKAE